MVITVVSITLLIYIIGNILIGDITYNWQKLKNIMQSRGYRLHRDRIALHSVDHVAWNIDDMPDTSERDYQILNATERLTDIKEESESNNHWPILCQALCSSNDITSIVVEPYFTEEEVKVT